MPMPRLSPARNDKRCHGHTNIIRLYRSDRGVEGLSRVHSADINIVLTKDWCIRAFCTSYVLYHSRPLPPSLLDSQLSTVSSTRSPYHVVSGDTPQFFTLSHQRGYQHRQATSETLKYIKEVKNPEKTHPSSPSTWLPRGHGAKTKDTLKLFP